MEEKTQALVEDMIHGSEAAFDELYRSYSGRLYRMAYFITGNKSDSEDVLQETFVKCFLYRKDLKQPERFSSWICRILVRTAWNVVKKKKGKSEVSFDGLLDQEQENGFSEKIREDIGTPEPVEQILRTETSRELWDAVHCLDARHRTVVLLYYYHDMSTREIAHICGTMEGTVKSRLHRARALLRERLNQDGTRKTEKERGLCHE